MLEIIYTLIRISFTGYLFLSAYTYIYMNVIDVNIIDSLARLKRKITDMYEILYPNVDQINTLKERFTNLSNEITEEHEKLSAQIEVQFAKINEKMEQLCDNDRVFDILITRFEQRMSEYEKKPEKPETNSWSYIPNDNSLSYLENYGDDNWIHRCN